MPSIKAATSLLVAGLLVTATWAAYRARWGHRPPPRVLPPLAQHTQPPLAEFREGRSGTAGETGMLLVIDRAGHVTLQTIPLGPRSKTMHAQLTCAEREDLPQAMKEEFRNFRPSNGREGPPYEGEISIVDAREIPERRVIWHNPPSLPKPPEGSWAHVVVYFEDIRRRAEEASAQTSENAAENVIVYGRSSSGIVGTYHYSLSIDSSGHVVLTGGLGWAAYQRRGQTQLTPEELKALVRTFEEAKFVEFGQCYGRHTVVNEQSTSLFYQWDGKENGVLWMWPPADPKPPDGWSRIANILDEIWARAEKEGSRKPAVTPQIQRRTKTSR